LLSSLPLFSSIFSPLPPPPPSLLQNTTLPSLPALLLSLLSSILVSSPLLPSLRQQLLSLLQTQREQSSPIIGVAYPKANNEVGAAYADGVGVAYANQEIENGAGVELGVAASSSTTALSYNTFPIRSSDCIQYPSSSLLPSSAILSSSIIELFIATNLYQDNFEDIYLKETEEFYSGEGEFFSKNFDLKFFLLHFEKREREEEERGRKMERRTVLKVQKIIEERLINRNLSKILEKGFEQLILGKELMFLEKVWGLLKKVGKVDFLKQTFGYYVKEFGKQIVGGSAGDEMIDGMIK
jgi:Cullin family